ncbi:unnamed protein product, partial [Rotaria socialis]
MTSGNCYVPDSVREELSHTATNDIAAINDRVNTFEKDIFLKKQQTEEQRDGARTLRNNHAKDADANLDKHDGLIQEMQNELKELENLQKKQTELYNQQRKLIDDFVRNKNEYDGQESSFKILEYELQQNQEKQRQLNEERQILQKECDEKQYKE